MNSLYDPRFQTLSETPSTQDLGRAWLRANPLSAHSHWVRALRQTQGRGRQGRSWDGGAAHLAPPQLSRDRLMVSAAFHFPPAPKLRTDVSSDTPLRPLLSLLAGQSLLRAICRESGACPELFLKWPNDLVFADPLNGDIRKVAGILAEAQGASGVVVGWGINLAGEVPPGAATLSQLPSLRPASLPPDFSDRLWAALAQTFSQDLRAWLREPRAFESALIASLRNFEMAPFWGRPGVWSGPPAQLAVARDLNPASGALVLELASGERVEAQSGEFRLGASLDNSL